MNKVNWKNGVLALGLIVGLLALDFSAVAQDAEITDEDLQKYATIMNQIDVLKVDLKAKTNEMVKGNELMDGGRKYKAIKGAKGDEAKLSEIGATEEEVTAFNTIEESIDAMKVEFKTTYTSLIKEDLGAGTYNKVKKGLAADAELKTKYDAILTALAESAETASEETSGEN